MTKIIVPFYAYTLTGMLMLGGVSAQTTREGDLRECTGRGWNTCNNPNWTHCMWVGTRDEGTCHNNCPVIGFPDNIGTPRDCHNLEGCDLVGFSTRCDFTDRDLQCSTANDDDWATTQRNCQALEGCTFSLIPGQNECIPVVDCSSANDRDWQTTWSQCRALDGCKFNTAWGENECIKDCSSANDANWLTTLAQCQVIKGCMFNPTIGKNECIEESSMAAQTYVSVESEDEVAEQRFGDFWGCNSRDWNTCEPLFQNPKCVWVGKPNDGICVPLFPLERNPLPSEAYVDEEKGYEYDDEDEVAEPSMRLRPIKPIHSDVYVSSENIWRPRPPNPPEIGPDFPVSNKPRQSLRGA